MIFKVPSVLWFYEKLQEKHCKEGLVKKKNNRTIQSMYSWIQLIKRATDVPPPTSYFLPNWHHWMQQLRVSPASSHNSSSVRSTGTMRKGKRHRSSTHPVKVGFTPAPEGWTQTTGQGQPMEQPVVWLQHAACQMQGGRFKEKYVKLFSTKILI